MTGIIAAAGSVVGGLLGFGGSLLGGKSASKNAKRAQAFEAQRIRMMVKDAKLAGIHPLAAMGVASSYQNPFQSVPSSGMANGLGSLGNSVSQAAVDYAQGQKQEKRGKVQAELFAVQKAESKARMAEALANADLAASRALAVKTGLKQASMAPPNGYENSPGAPYGRGYVGNTDMTTGAPINSPTPLYRKFKDKEGRTVTRLSSELPDIDQVAVEKIQQVWDVFKREYAERMKNNPPVFERRRIINRALKSAPMETRRALAEILVKRGEKAAWNYLRGKVN